MEGSRSLFTARGRCVSSVEFVSRLAQASRRSPEGVPGRVIGAGLSPPKAALDGSQAKERFQGPWLNIHDLHAGGETNGRGANSSLPEAAG